MASIPELLQTAAAWRQSGQLGPAEQAYRYVLELDPGHAEALAQLGLLAYQGGRPGPAVEYLRRAAEAQPADGARRNNLGVVLLGLGRATEAEAAYREALRLRPDYAEAHNNLGVALRALGRLAEAEAAYREAVRLKPDYPEAHNNLGVALIGQGRPAEAEAAYREALRLRAGYPEALNNLGVALGAQGRWAEAEAAYRAAVRLRPGYASAHSNLGNVLRDQGRPAEAETAYREALRLQPGSAEARANLGNALRELGRIAEAETALREAIRLRPDSAPAHHSLGNLLLSLGRFEEGWAEYEWRLRDVGPAPRDLGRPAWDGSALGGTLLLWTEQGLGDTLQFVRYATLARERAGAVVLECPPALVPLLSRCPGVDRLVGRGTALPAFDAHAALLSLPHLLGTTTATVPAAVPYLSPDPDLVRRWRDELASLPGFKVGIVWQGSPRMLPYDRRRSFPLAALEPLAQLPGVHLVVLQKGPGREQLTTVAGDWPLADLGDRLDESGGAFMDTAAVMQNLDLVVTCDSAPAHLAGALGVPTWVALPSVADWRWLVGREDSPWYPTLRLFRQSQPGDWAGVFGRMADALHERLTGTPPRPPDAPRGANVAELFQTAVTCHLAGQLGPAEQAYQQILEIDPGHAEALGQLGLLALAGGQGARALEYMRRSVQARPDSADAHYNLGVALIGQGRADEGVAAYREAARLRPGHAETHYNLGIALSDLGRPAEAEAAYREALRLRPDFAQGHSNLGNVLRAQGRLAEAEAEYREALRLKPDSAEIRTNLGVALSEQGRPAEAEYREALRLRPDHAEAHTNLGLLLLSQGRFAEGWVEYGWRWHIRRMAPRPFTRPAWDGAPLGGGTLLLYAEQGLGDLLQFVRYAALVRPRVGRIVLECPPALIPLLSRCPGVDRVVGQGALLPAFDVQAPLLSLPLILGTTPETIPANVPYLSADPKLVRRWRGKLAALKGFKVGVAWQGNPAHPEQHRFMPLRSFAPLAALPGVRLVSLQKGASSEHLAGAADLGVTELGGGVDQAGAFMDTAAVMRHLDLVVTADTAVAHLAGGLGVPTWVALPSVPNWRWLLEREDSPWYPTVRLFRQRQPGEWGDVFGRMAAALRERLN